jgi:hypothetical protein
MAILTQYMTKMVPSKTPFLLKNWQASPQIVINKLTPAADRTTG